MPSRNVRRRGVWVAEGAGKDDLNFVEKIDSA
jgi:hypothetical protein